MQILILFFSLQLAFGQFGTPKVVNENPLTATVIGFSDAKLYPGENKELKIKLELAPDYHAYLEQYRLELATNEIGHLSEFQVRPTVKFTDPISKKVKIGTEGISEMTALYDVPAQLPRDKNSLQLKLTYQACGKDFCLFPKTIDINIPFENPAKHTPTDSALVAALSKSLLNAFLLVFLAGLLTCFTPCIFPMIPITLAVIGSRDIGKSKARGFTLSLIYVNGIALTYSIMGIIAAKTGSLFGALLGHPVAVGTVSLLFVLMGLSMYGLFEIQMPQFIVRRFGHSKLEKNVIGAFGSGLIAGVVASPCVGPVLIGILTYVAQTQNTTLGFWLLYTFALGLGLPFIILGTFHGLLHHLPKSGAWMEKVKFIFGTMMIGMAVYFVRPITAAPLFDGLIATTLMAIGYFFGAFQKVEAHEPKWQRAVFRVIFVAGMFFAMKALIPKQIFNGVAGGSNPIAESENYAKPQWSNYSEELLAQAKAAGRPVILDIHAEWCLACKELEKYTFSDPNVLALGNNFLWLSFDATQTTPEFETLKNKYGIGGLPFVAFFDKNGNYRNELTLFGFEKAEDFLKRMEIINAESRK